MLKSVPWSSQALVDNRIHLYSDPDECRWHELIWQSPLSPDLISGIEWGCEHGLEMANHHLRISNISVLC
jgi:hypothetical protein